VRKNGLADESAADSQSNKYDKGVKRSCGLCYDNGIKNVPVSNISAILSGVGVMTMARFYDSVNDTDLDRIERLLKHGGVEYSLQILGEGVLLKEIQVAEEDLAEAERILAQPLFDD
jgi:hypothetical protein